MNPMNSDKKTTFNSGEKLKVFISSTMFELRDVREVVSESLLNRGIYAWVYEVNAGARPESVAESSLIDVESSDIYIGIFWKDYGQVTIKEFKHARTLGKPCFIYIRDKDTSRDQALQDFLKREVYDPERGLAYTYFDKSIKLGEQIANDIMSWIVRSHRDMTAEIKAARVSSKELSRIKIEVERLQNASKNQLPIGTSLDYLAQQMRVWFETLGYRFETSELRDSSFFEWIINIQVRRGYERILVRGIEGEAEISDIHQLRSSVDTHKADEGWLVAVKRISQAAANEIEKPENSSLFCYTFDELIDENADFNRYIEWLESEVKRLGIDKMYIPLSCIKEEFDPKDNKKLGVSIYDKNNGWIDGYIDRWLDDPSKEHISILGEFGTGKTWFVLHYAWSALQRYLDAKKRGVERPRLPLVVPLRDYAKAVSVESLFSEFFFRKHEIPLPGYSAFEKLNRMGKFLLIFDGFDEMAAKIDRQKMVNNFWELARVVVPGAKAVLTCRTEHFPEAIEGQALLGAELKASTANLSGEPPQFEVLELQKFSDEQVYQLLSLRTEPDVAKHIIANSQLLDLARRPIMSELIIDALPEIEAGRPIDLPRLYLYAVYRKMESDIKAERTFTSLADKLFFMCEVSWEMLSSDSMSLNYREFPERLRRLFGLMVHEQKDLDHWHYDMMGQTMLVRNAYGDYTPAHRSLIEFFVAYKFVAELGILAHDFCELAKSQSHIDWNFQPQTYAWSNYFNRITDDEGQIKSIPPLEGFNGESIDKLAETFGLRPLSKAILVMMEKMFVDDDAAIKETLLRNILNTADNTPNKVGLVGGNSATLLAKYTQESLRGIKMQRVNLDYADLSGADISESDVSSASLKFVRFHGTNLSKTNLKNSDLSNAIFQDIRTINSIAFSPNGKYLAIGGDDSLVHLWDISNGIDWSFSLHGHKSAIKCICWSGNSEIIASGDKNGLIFIWDANRREKMFSCNIGSDVSNLCFGKETFWVFAEKYDFPRIIEIELNRGIVRGAQNSCVKFISYNKIPYFDGDISISIQQDNKIPISESNKNNSIIHFFKILRGNSYYMLMDSQQMESQLMDINYQKSLIAFVKDYKVIVAFCEPNGFYETLDIVAPATCVSINLEGNRIATGTSNGEILIWDICRYFSQDGKVPNSNYGKAIQILKQKLNCSKLKIKGAKGIKGNAPSGTGKLIDWLIERGAIS
jgi:hypothetical protein